jgi:hypothetical protein
MLSDIASSFIVKDFTKFVLQCKYKPLCKLDCYKFYIEANINDEIILRGYPPVQDLYKLNIYSLQMQKLRENNFMYDIKIYKYNILITYDDRIELYNKHFMLIKKIKTYYYETQQSVFTPDNKYMIIFSKENIKILNLENGAYKCFKLTKKHKHFTTTIDECINKEVNFNKSITSNMKFYIANVKKFNKVQSVLPKKFTHNFLEESYDFSTDIQFYIENTQSFIYVYSISERIFKFNKRKFNLAIIIPNTHILAVSTNISIYFYLLENLTLSCKRENKKFLYKLKIYPSNQIIKYGRLNKDEIKRINVSDNGKFLYVYCNYENIIFKLDESKIQKEIFLHAIHRKCIELSRSEIYDKNILKLIFLFISF